MYTALHVYGIHIFDFHLFYFLFAVFLLLSIILSARAREQRKMATLAKNKFSVRSINLMFLLLLLQAAGNIIIILMKVHKSMYIGIHI